MVRFALARLVAALSAIAGVSLPPLSHASAQTMTMTRSDAKVMHVAADRVIVLRQDGSAIVIDGVVGDSSGAGGPDLRRGDRISRIAQLRAPSLDDLMRAYTAIPVGADVTLGIVRDGGAEREVRFPRVAAQSGRTMAVAATGSAGAGAGAWTSAATGSAAAFSIAGANIAENDEGMPAVTHRSSHPAAASVALRVGDEIVRINDRPIAALRGLQEPYEAMASGARVTLTVRRAGQLVEVAFNKPQS